MILSKKIRLYFFVSIIIFFTAIGMFYVWKHLQNIKFHVLGLECMLVEETVYDVINAEKTIFPNTSKEKNYYRLVYNDETYRRINLEALIFQTDPQIVSREECKDYFCKYFNFVELNDDYIIVNYEFTGDLGNPNSVVYKKPSQISINRKTLDMTYTNYGSINQIVIKYKCNNLSRKKLNRIAKEKYLERTKNRIF